MLSPHTQEKTGWVAAAEGALLPLGVLILTERGRRFLPTRARQPRAGLDRADVSGHTRGGTGVPAQRLLCPVRN